MNRKMTVCLGCGASFVLLGFCVLHAFGGLLFSGIAAALFVLGTVLVVLGISTLLSESQRVLHASEDRIVLAMEAMVRVPQDLEVLTGHVQQALEAMTAQVQKLSADTNACLEKTVGQLVQSVEAASDAVKHDVKESVGIVDSCKQEIVTQVPQSVMKTAELVVRSFDEVTGKLSSELSAVRDSIEDLLDDMTTKFTSTTKAVRDGMGNITDDLQAHEESIKACIDSITSQCKEFERINESVVQQLTLMSQNDLHALKELMHG